MRRTSFLIPTAGLFCIALSLPVSSKTFTVSSAQELSAALAEAQNNGDSDVINLMNGQYLAVGGKPFTFDSTEAFDLTLVGNEFDPTQVVLSGGTENVLVLRNGKNGGTFTLKGLTLVGGQQGLKTDNANTRIEFCAFNGQALSDDSAETEFPPSVGNNLTILSSVFTGNMLPVLDDKNSLESLDPEALSQSGNWVLLGTSEAITDMSHFDRFNAVWSYQDGQWKAYSARQDIKIRAQAKGVVELDKIPAHSGFWIWRD